MTVSDINENMNDYIIEKYTYYVRLCIQIIN